MRTNINIEKLSDLFSSYNLKKENWVVLLGFTKRFSLVLLFAYIAASIASAAIMSLLIGSAVKGFSAKPRIQSNITTLNLVNSTNYRDLSRSIVERNLFNSDGEVPNEPDPVKSEGTAGVFDPNAGCQKTSLKIALLGTIYLGATGDSLATVKDETYSEADIYKAGDVIFGSQAKVHAIEQSRLIINNNGVKECLELVPAAVLTAQAGGDGTIADDSTRGGDDRSEGAGGGGCTSATVEAVYVEKELGPGFANILTKGRLVPDSAPDGTTKGFKLIGMDSNSLFAKICLRNNDVITAVNDTSMTQPEQGFALYQAFQDDREVRINILRGETPRTITVRIR